MHFVFGFCRHFSFLVETSIEIDWNENHKAFWNKKRRREKKNKEITTKRI